MSSISSFPILLILIILYIRKSDCFTKVAPQLTLASIKQTRLYEMTTSAQSFITISEGLKKFISLYDVFIIDQWGVLHDGSHPYPGVLETLHIIKSMNKKLILLSNSSKRRLESIKSLTKLGFDTSLFEDVITSGELAWESIRSRRKSMLDKLHLSHLLVDKKEMEPLKVFTIGNGDDDEEYILSANCIPAIPEEADFILARGTFSILCDNKSQLDYESKRYQTSKELFDNLEPWLVRCANRKLPMIVSNPDMSRPGTNDPMPGRIAKLYHSIRDDTKIKYYGKPHKNVYEKCLEIVERIDRTRICGIGDSLEHDILGAVNNDIDSIWVMNGVHSNILGTMEGSIQIPSSQQIEDILLKYGSIPTHIIPKFLLVNDD